MKYSSKIEEKLDKVAQHLSTPYRGLRKSQEGKNKGFK